MLTRSKIYILLLLLLLCAGCSSVPENVSSSSGNILLYLAQEGVTKSIMPSISMDIVGYTINFTGPKGSNFSTNITDTNITLQKLPSGNWAIQVNAYNYSNIVIANGSGITTVRSGGTSELLITVGPLAGTGNMNISIDWDMSDTNSHEILGTLTSFSGGSYNLLFTTNSNSGTCITNSLPVGYYSLTLSLKENGVLTAGGTEIIRIVKDETTSGIFISDTRGKTPGITQLKLILIANMANPIPVIMSGQINTIGTNQPMHVSASVPSNTGSVIFTWYINGALQSTGPIATVSIGTSGYYRLDVTAFTINGIRAGSASFNFNVINGTVGLPSGPPPVDLGSSGNFVILGQTRVSTANISDITGDVGVDRGKPDLQGFAFTMDSSGTFATSSQVTGKLYAHDFTSPTPAMLDTAVTDMVTAFSNAAAQTPADYTNLGAGEIGGMTLFPGLYNWTTGLSISSDVTLSGGPNDVWIFQISGTLSISSNVSINLTGGAQASGICWQASSALLNAASYFEGTILTSGGITMGFGATATGRLLAQTTVSLNHNTVIQP